MDSRLLPQALALHTEIRDQLRLAYPEIADDALRDTVEGLSDLSQILATMVRSYLDDAALATALRGRISEMEGRLARIEMRVDKKRGLVASVMERADMKTLREPEFTVSTRPTPRPLVIIDEAEIPEEFWKPQPSKLDRKRLLVALSSGQAVNGAALGNAGVTIAVRTS